GVGLSAALHLAGWIVSAIGAWIAFRLIGARVDLAAVMAIESLVYATRSAAAFIPNALGVQEAAYAVLAPLFGVGAEFGLAVSVLKRARGRRALRGPASRARWRRPRAQIR